MLRRLHPEQPGSFAFTKANQTWAEAQLRKYPEGRRASAIIPLLWRAQEQEGWLTRAAIEHVAEMLGLAYMRALEVATFYFMFQLQPVGRVAHFQICGTTSCMICGAEDLIAVCRDKVAPTPHTLSQDGKFSWEEVECLGACANAPMAQIGKDYYEDLDAEGFAALIDAMARGETPAPGPQNGRFAAEPLGGATSLTGHDKAHDANASVTLAREGGDTLKRIDGTEPASHIHAPIALENDAGAHSSDAMHGADQPARFAGDAPASKARKGDGADIAQADQAASQTPAARETSHHDSASMHGDGQPARFAGDAPSSATRQGDGADAAQADQSASQAPVTSDHASATMHGDDQPARFAGDAPDSAVRKGDGSDAAQADQAASQTAAALAPSDDDRPELYAEAPQSGGDDLKQIKGVGPKLEGLLNSLGVWRFAQIAGWSDKEVAWVDHHLEGFKGRIKRDDWVAQAKLLAAGGQTEFAKRVESGDVPSSKG